MIPFFQKPESLICRNYLAASKNRLAGKTPLNEVRFVALDIESSGFKIGKDRILSIAVFEVVNGRIDIGRSRKWIVYQPDATPTAATAIHGILPCETREGRLEKEVLEELIPILSGAVVVGHHVRFDSAMLNEALLRNFKIKFKNWIVDTAQLAMNELIAFHRTGYANQRPPSLDEVCSQLNLPMIARHTAEGDAFTTAEIFLLLCGRIRRRLNSYRLRCHPPQVRDLSIVRYRK